MSQRSVGLALLNVAGVLVIVGALYDLLVPSVPQNHLSYVGATDGSLDPRYAALDLAMLRSIGGCLLAIGATALVLANGPIRRGETWARVTVAFLVGVAEGNNAYRMFPFGSPWYGPLGFAALAVVGAALASPPVARSSAAGHGPVAEPVAAADSTRK
ncbi:MAG: hypothetical protein U0795_11810 [Pirellulales bacterium]